MKEKLKKQKRNVSASNETTSKSRNSTIVKTSFIGILANVFLAGFKAFVGLASHSIAIVMDAVNNISDAASSVITIVGTKLAGKQPDKKHPFGYGRIEYLSAMVISLLVLYAGVTAFTESVKKIITPEEPDYGIFSLVVVGVAVVIKILLGLYFKKVGKKVNSDSLVNSGKDATMDSIISASTLLAAGIFLLFNISLEAWLGAIIAILIIKSGIEMLKDTLSKILGERVDANLAREIKKTVNSYDQISGTYDIVLHNYGPDAFNGSLHIEVPDTLSADALDELIRTVTMDVYQKHNVILTAIGVYSVNTKDPDAVAIRKAIAHIVMATEYVLQMHGFYVDNVNKKIRFDVVVSLDSKDRISVYNSICEKVQALYPDYAFEINMDTDFTEE